MTPDMKELPAELGALAGKLTKAQRERLCRPHGNEREMGGFGVIYDDRGGYFEPPLVERVGVNHPIFGSHWRMTPLGLSLRAYLQANPIPDLDSKEVGR